MKLTISKKEIEEAKINWKMLPAGTVIRTQEGYVCVVVKKETCGTDQSLVALQGRGGCEYDLHISKYCEHCQKITEILGTISEIIIEEN